MDNINDSNKNNNSQIATSSKYGDIIFAGDSFGLFVFKRTEKVASAVYLLTSLLSDKEPLKWSLRQVSNRAVAGSVNLSNRVWGQKDYLSEILNAYSEMNSLFEIANIAGIISSMNFQIISTEIGKIIKLLSEAMSGTISDISIFPEGYFSGAEYQAGSRNSFARAGLNIDKGQKDIKDSNVLYKNTANKHVHDSEIKKDKNSRQDKIVAMLSGGKVLTIKDFSSEIKDCSEKTIQRELLALVAKNVLKKEGERRWSKYSLS